MEKTEALEYQRDEHRVYLILYHLIWCSRRRKSIVTGELKDRFGERVTMKCQEKGWAIHTLAIQPDHIHLCVAVRERCRCGEGIERNNLFSSQKGISTHLEEVAFVMDEKLLCKYQWCGECSNDTTGY